MMHPRIVILTGDGAEHRFVTNKLCHSVDVSKILVDHKKSQPMTKRAFKAGLGVFIGKVLRSLFMFVTLDKVRRQKTVRSILGEECETFIEADKIVDVVGVNSPETLSILNKLEPDILLVYGTGVVQSEALSTAKMVVMNMHTGCSPYYRGTGCVLWPLANNELDKIGATIHECTTNLDGGLIYERICISCKKGDTIHSLFARAVRSGAVAYADVIDRYINEQSIAGVPQDLTIGREYRGVDQTIWPELQARWNLLRLK